MDNLRETYKVQVVSVLEGNGTKEMPYVEVRYLSQDDQIIGYIHEMPFKYWTPEEEANV